MWLWQRGIVAGEVKHGRPVVVGGVEVGSAPQAAQAGQPAVKGPEPHAVGPLHHRLRLGIQADDAPRAVPRAQLFAAAMEACSF